MAFFGVRVSVNLENDIVLHKQKVPKSQTYNRKKIYLRNFCDSYVSFVVVCTLHHICV